MASTPKIEHTPLPTPTAFGMLSRIPPELRLKIYRELILEGSVRFLRSSKAIHGEAIEVLLQEGVCRLEFDGYKSLDIYPSPYWSRNTMMNLEIRLVLNHTYGSDRFKRKCINRFNKWMTVFLYCVDRHGNALEPRYESVPRKSCKILIDCDKYFLRHLPLRIFRFIKFLDGFEVLALAIADDYPEEPKTRINDRLYHPKPDPLRRMELAMHSPLSEDTKYAYGLAQKALRRTLGAGELICDGKGAHLEFHPRDYDFSEVEEEVV